MSDLTVEKTLQQSLSGCNILLFSNVEYCDMYLILGSRHGNYAAAAAEYSARYIHRRHPDRKVFQRLDQRFRETGQLINNHNHDRGRPRKTRTPQLEEQVLQEINTFPGRSTRQLGRTLGVHHCVMGKILKSEHLHPFHYRRVLVLHEGGYEPRAR
jgi:hypothetical protein